MSAPADVLAVMDAAIDHVICPAAITLPTANGLREARTAVAELIEAANRVVARNSSEPTVAVSTKDIAHLRRTLDNAGAAP